MHPFSSDEFEQRISRLQNLLRAKNINVAVFNQSADLYYYTGSVLPLYLVVPASHAPFLLARKAETRITGDVPFIKLEFFIGSKDLQNIWSSHNLSSSNAIGFTLDATSYATVMRIRQLSPTAEINDLSQDVRFLRMIKSPAEISVMRKAGGIIGRMPDIIRKHFAPGMTELSLSAHIEHFFRESGMGVVNSKQEGLVLISGVTSCGLNSLEGNKFDGICAGKGASSSAPFGAADEIIPSGEPVLFDYGFVYEGYHADMTRMASEGRPKKEVIDAYCAMVEIEKALIAFIKPGVPWESVYELSVSMANRMGYADIFMGIGRDRVRFVGHGVGIQLDEPPFLAPKMSTLLEKNMVVAVEPKVALPGIGVVGIEDTVLVGDEQNETITPASDEFIIL
jgi:Xaa-Pro dipeptidase